jgi:SAM-dependent methyltransferase
MRDPQPVTWEELADWYDAKQGDVGDLWHRTLIDPVLLARIGEVAGHDVLDLGCGNGYLARRLQRAGARVTGVDRSERLIEAAREREARGPLGVRYLVADAGDLGPLSDGSFDLVFANMVLMDLPDAGAAIREVGRVLRAYGRFVASFDHPCFGGDAGARWILERDGDRLLPSRRIDAYREVFDDPGAWNAPEGRTLATPAFHRPLSWYADRLREARLAIVALDEPAGDEEFRAQSPLAGAIATVPLHLVVEAIRLPFAAGGGGDRPSGPPQ